MMNKIAANSMELLITIGLIYGVLKYWNWKLKGGYDIESHNNSYGAFLTLQVITILLIIVLGIDPQNSAYLDHLTFFGDGAYDYWSYTGIEIFGFVLLFMISNVIGHLLFNSTFSSENGLYEDIRENKIGSALIVSAIILSISVVASIFVLRPFLFEWVSRNAGFIPLN